MSQVIVICLSCGCQNKHAVETFDDLEIMFITLSNKGLGQPLGMFVVKNVTDSDCSIQGIEVCESNATQPIASDLLKFTHKTISPRSLEFGVFRISSADYVKKLSLNVHYEKNKKRFYASKLIDGSEIWSKGFYVAQDLKTLFFYIETEHKIEPEHLKQCQIQINGNKASIADIVVFPAQKENSVVCIQATPDKTLSKGERIFISATFDGITYYGGVTKVFYAFALGGTQYDKVVRPVSIEHVNGDVQFHLYNEADFRKSPAVIEQVRMDGKDITNQCVLPEALPPDLHHFEKDVRDLVVKNLNLKNGETRRFDIDFKRQKPLRNETTPEGYFKTQTFSFKTRHNVPFEMDCDEGLKDGVCVFYAGLWQRPEFQEILRRCSSVYDADPNVPVYAYPHEGTKPETAYQIAACCDFIAAGQTIPLIPPTFERAKKYFQYYNETFRLPVAWVGSVMSDNDHATSPEDLRWLTWGAIGAGSHGVFLTSPEKGDAEIIASCQKAQKEILAEVQKQNEFLGISYPIKLHSVCNQSGIHFDFLSCGTDHIFIVALNEWGTRSVFQEAEPFMAAPRIGVELAVTTGENWKAISAVDPITNESIEIAHEKETVLKLPTFNNVQIILLGREKFNGTNEKVHEIPPIVFEDSPIVSLGKIRPETIHKICVPIKSNWNTQTVLSGKEISQRNSKPGRVILQDIPITAREKGALSFEYTSPQATGNSVTHIRFESPDIPDFSMPIYVCADVQEPVELSHTMLDFGCIPIGTRSDMREVKVKSKYGTCKIESITADNEQVVHIQKNEDEQSFNIFIQSNNVGTISSSLDVALLLDDTNEVIHKTVRCLGQIQKTVFASPSIVSVVIADQPKRYTIEIQHVSDKPIKIVSVTCSSFLDWKIEKEKYARHHQLEITVFPKILETEKAELMIKGNTEDGENFTITIPVTAFSSNTNNPQQERTQ
ncbi:MAG: hypothetical protein LBJ67_04795 [Planctomycetaceae bacterium]|nr:hypothetical protein [Planctomycetaceae bacterium]